MDEKKQALERLVRAVITADRVRDEFRPSKEYWDAVQEETEAILNAMRVLGTRAEDYE